MFSKTIITSVVILGGFFPSIQLQVSAEPQLEPGSSDYALIGCYTELNANPSGRALGQNNKHIAPITNTSISLTVPRCLKACKDTVGLPKAGWIWNFAAVENQRECYCGSTVDERSVPVDARLCNSPCTGNVSQSCGGYGFLTLYGRIVSPSSTIRPTQTLALPTSDPTSSAIPTNTPTPQPTGISSATKAGIILGCILAFLTILAVATFFYRRRYQRRCRESSSNEKSLPYSHPLQSHPANANDISRNMSSNGGDHNLTLDKAIEPEHSELAADSQRQLAYKADFNSDMKHAQWDKVGLVMFSPEHAHETYNPSDEKEVQEDGAMRHFGLHSQHKMLPRRECAVVELDSSPLTPLGTVDIPDFEKFQGDRGEPLVETGFPEAVQAPMPGGRREEDGESMVEGLGGMARNCPEYRSNSTKQFSVETGLEKGSTCEDSMKTKRISVEVRTDLLGSEMSRTRGLGET